MFFKLIGPGTDAVREKFVKDNLMIIPRGYKIYMSGGN